MAWLAEAWLAAELLVVAWLAGASLAGAWLAGGARLAGAWPAVSWLGLKGWRRRLILKGWLLRADGGLIPRRPRRFVTRVDATMLLTYTLAGAAQAVVRREHKERGEH